MVKIIVVGGAVSVTTAVAVETGVVDGGVVSMFAAEVFGGGGGTTYSVGGMSVASQS